jgi:hypothetical protein
VIVLEEEIEVFEKLQGNSVCTITNSLRTCEKIPNVVCTIVVVVKHLRCVLSCQCCLGVADLRTGVQSLRQTTDFYPRIHR